MRFDDRGNVGLTFALMAPVLLGFAGVAIDFQHMTASQSRLQEAADDLALRGARELLLENASASNIEALIRSWAQQKYAPKLGLYEVAPRVAASEGTVSVAFTQTWSGGFILGKISKQTRRIEASAIAQAQGTKNVCVIALETDANDTIRADNMSKLNAPDCSIISNSKGTSGVNVSSTARLTAGLICSAGGYKGSSTNYSPMPVTDCPNFDDPLSGRTPPIAAKCDYTDTQIGVKPASITSAFETLLASQTAALNGSDPATPTGYTRFDLTPGVYCGGLEINGKSDAHLAPGIYVIKDGALKVAYGARLYGENVGFFMTGKDATFIFEPASIAHLTAPKSDLMAGVLFWEDASAPEDNMHFILSSNARQLLGTIYLPRGQLKIASIMPVADKSAYTAIVARTLQMSGSPTLVLNTDYAGTDVPVPAGLGAIGGEVFLRN
jgi:hypothetical protein